MTSNNARPVVLHKLILEDRRDTNVWWVCSCGDRGATPRPAVLSTSADHPEPLVETTKRPRRTQ